MAGRTNKKVKVVMVGFRTGQERPYQSIEALNVGDKVVIETNKKHLVVASVTQIKNISIKKTKNLQNWIVQKVDLKKYRQITKRLM